MNENLMRDLHDTQIEEIAAVKTAIAELAKRPTATPNDIARLQVLIANIKIPAQDFSELKRFVQQQITNTATHTQVAQVDKLIRSCNNNLVDIYDSIDKRLGEVATLQRCDNKPQTIIHKFELSSWRVLFFFIGVVITSFVMSLCTYNLYIENERLQANDVKYRYIKMTVGTGGDYIEEVEEFVRTNADGKALQTLEDRVDAYERTVADKLRAEEQARLRAAKAAELNREAAELGRKANELKQK
ncbi:MAG: hypothetical protein R3Y68_08540 [Rikenellaceae bacterium]